MLMIDDWLLSLIYAAWLAASTMPLGFNFGLACSPCCGCGVADGKPRTDPKDEGTWVPSGTWRGVGGVAWNFTANPGDESGETWFFYGSAQTSRIGGLATLEERQDWGNICNWYSNKTTSPNLFLLLPSDLNKRATRLPPDTAVVHVYTSVNTASVGPRTVKNIFFWNSFTTLLSGSEITCTDSAHDSAGGAVFNNNNSQNAGILNGGATFNFTSDNFGTVNDAATFNGSTSNGGTVNGGATFNDSSINFIATVNDGATFNDSSLNSGAGSTVNGGATFNGNSRNREAAIVNGGAIFNDNSQNILTLAVGGIVNGGATFNGNSLSDNSTINGGATFNDGSRNRNGSIVNGGATFNDNSRNEFGGVVNDGATFNENAQNLATVEGGATFNDDSQNGNTGIVNDGATFNDNSQNTVLGTVNGGAIFNDSACSRRIVGGGPCNRRFVAHPTDLPTCNGTAVDGCFTPANICGCG